MKAAGPILALLAFLTGCASTPKRVTEVPRAGDDCPWMPESLTRAEEIAALRRAAREVRANLTAEVRGHEGARLVATIHPPVVSLLMAAVRAPRKAREPTASWLAQTLLRCWIELRSAKAIPALDRGEVDRLRLVDQHGQHYPPLLVRARRDGPDRVYRIEVPPIFIAGSQLKLRLTLPPADPIAGKSVELRWVLAAHDSLVIERLPVLFQLLPSARLRQVRWLVLMGQLEAAARLADRIVSCSPQNAEARMLAQLLSGASPRSSSKRPVEAPLTQFSDEPRSVARMGQSFRSSSNVVAGLTPREGLLRRLAPAAAVGLLPEGALKRLQKGLSAEPAALIAFDERLNALLVAALHPGGKVHRRHGHALPAPSRAGEAGLVRTQTSRLAGALRGYRPQHVAARTPNHGRLPDEVTPSLSLTRGAETISATGGPLKANGAGGWMHPGLPRGKYKVVLLDRSTAHWRQKIHRAGRLDELKAVVPALVRLALEGVDLAAFSVAVKGVLAMKGVAGLGALLAREQQLPPRQLAVVVGAIAHSKAGSAAALIRRAADHSSSEVRQAAVDALRGRRLLEERPLLRKLAADRMVRVKDRALAALIHMGDRAASREVAGWKGDQGVDRAAAVIGLAAPLPKAMRRGLRAQALQMLAHKPTPQTLAAAGEVLGRSGAVRFQRLFLHHPALRPQLAVLGVRFGLPKLIRAARDDQAVATRRALAEAFSRQKGTSGLLLGKLRKDKDSRVRLWAEAAAARAGDAMALLAIGAKARESCEQARIVLPVLAPSMDSASRRRLFAHALGTSCDKLAGLVWDLVIRLQANDVHLLRLGMLHPKPWLRTYAALTVAGLKRRLH